MAEEAEGQDTGAEASGAGVDPAAVTLALHAAQSDPSIAEDARAFLRNQNSLIDIQKHHLNEQFKQLAEQLKQLRLQVWEKRLGVLLRIATAFVGLAFMVFLSATVWNAAHSDGLVIESFSVPPEMAANGLTGQVVASQILDQMIAINAGSTSVRAPKSFTNSWVNDIKVEIPDTGVSVGEAYRLLKNWLGHETHISGEVYRTASGIAITARVSGGVGETVSGSEADLNALAEKLAEKFYGGTQPFLYGYYLASHGRADEAAMVLRALATNGPPQERAWGYDGWAVVVEDSVGSSMNLSLFERAAVLQPDNLLFLNNLAARLQELGQPQEVLRNEREAQSVFQNGGGIDQIKASRIPGLQAQSRERLDDVAGAFHEAALEMNNAITTSPDATRVSRSFYLAEDEARAHDLAEARSAMADPVGVSGLASGTNVQNGITAQIVMADEAKDWEGVLSQAKRLDPLMLKYPGVRANQLTFDAPLISYAQARLGDFAAAETSIAPTPDNCDPCLRARARIAELKGEHARADWWFARAAQESPSIPFAYADWGQALMERGDLDGAVVKFTLANQKGPHFADPLEMWGEALMAKNRSDLALAKFEEAEKYAPNWGRLHLKWGEALMYAGKKDEAQKQFALAAGLDLTAAEKAELAHHP